MNAAPAGTTLKFAALHEPDMVIGGYANGVRGYGDFGVNSSLGAQNRLMQNEIYKAVSQVPPDDYLQFILKVKKSELFKFLYDF